MTNRTLPLNQVHAFFAGRTADDLITQRLSQDAPDITVTHVPTGHTANFGTQDLILSDEDFINNRVKVLLKQWCASPANPEDIEVVMTDPKVMSGGTTVDTILAERGSTHGDYLEMSAVIQAIKAAMHGASMWHRMHSAQQESLDLTATKIGRIVCGDPMHFDHWDDIIGYNKLARDATAKAKAKEASK